MKDAGTAPSPTTASTASPSESAQWGMDDATGTVHLDLAEEVHYRVEALLGAVPTDRDEAASMAWLAAADDLIVDAGDYDRARVLEMRGIVRANLSSTHHSAHARDFHQDAAAAGELYERLGEPLAAATNYANAAIAAVQAEQIGEALEIAVRALVAFSSMPASVSDTVGEARMANMLGVLCYQFFDYERALQFHEIALRCLTAPEEVHRRTAAMHNVVEVALLQAHELPADAPRREELLQRAEELTKRLIEDGEPTALRVIDGPRLMASLLCERNRPLQAWPLLDAATRAAGTPPSRGQVGALRLARGRCLQLLGRPAQALVELDAALDIFDVDWDLAEFILAVQLRSVVREQAGDVAGALTDARRLSDHLWTRHQRQVGGFMDQVWGRAGVEGARRDLEAQAQVLLRSAEQDPLTGLANRRAVERFCASLPSHETVCLVLVDVDHFKQVNDDYGHGVGDDALKAVGGVLSRAVRSVDRVARWGGEEFLLALPSPSHELGVEAASRIRQRIEAYDWSTIADGLQLTVSGGVAFGPAGKLADVLARADQALYTAKRAGRNRVIAA
jgi:diguanylate cyclase (GGDEF)-like protein